MVSRWTLERGWWDILGHERGIKEMYRVDAGVGGLRSLRGADNDKNARTMRSVSHRGLKSPREDLHEAQHGGRIKRPGRSPTPGNIADDENRKECEEDP